MFLGKESKFFKVVKQTNFKEKYFLKLEELIWYATKA